MWFPSVLHAVELVAPRARAERARRRAARSRCTAARLCLEPLEDRCLLSINAALVEGYGVLPLRFEANQGQADAAVQFLSRGTDQGLFMVLVSDGVNTGRAVTPSPFVIPRKAPEVVIPSGGSDHLVVAGGRVLVLSGLGLDPEDGALDGDALVPHVRVIVASAVDGVTRLLRRRHHQSTFTGPYRVSVYRLFFGYPECPTREILVAGFP